MTIDQRLDRLTERHEALTQTVELMLQSHQMHSERLDRIETMLDLSLQQQKVNQEVLNSVVRRIDSLVTIMEHHETRLSRLELPGRS